MPIMNGIVATARLRELGVNIPVIGVTGNTGDEDRMRFMQAGAVDVLNKPFTKNALECTLTAVFKLTS